MRWPAPPSRGGNADSQIDYSLRSCVAGKSEAVKAMMPPLPLLSVLLLAGPSCDNGTFPTKLHRRQYMGLSGAGVTATDDECREKCCAAGKAKCDVWLRAEPKAAAAVDAEQHSGWYPVGSCFIGIAKGTSGSSPVWSGERLGEDPPPPPPPPPPVPLPADLSQRYTPVPMGTKPLRVLDLASETAWTASVDGATARKITVPGGGYNSDLQPKPWIDGYNAVRDNVTYHRKLSNLTHPGGGGAVLLEFGGVAHGAEVYLTPVRSAAGCGSPSATTAGGGSAASTKVAQHYGPMIPFAADLTHVLAQHPVRKTAISFHLPTVRMNSQVTTARPHPKSSSEERALLSALRGVRAYRRSAPLQKTRRGV